MRGHPTVQCQLGLLLALCVALPDAAMGVTLAPGDIIVAEAGGTDLVHVIDSASGAVKGSCACTDCSSIRDVAVSASGTIFVLGSLPSGYAIVEIDPRTCSERIASSGDKFDFPRGIAVESSGTIVVTDQSCVGCQNSNFARGGVLRVDPGSGLQSILFSGFPLRSPEGLDVAPDGRLYVAANVADAGGGLIGSGVVRIDASQSAPTATVVAVESGSSGINSAEDIAIENATGPVYVLDHRFRGSNLQDEMRLIEVNLQGDPTSNQTILTASLEGIQRDRHSCCSPKGIGVRGGILYALDYVSSFSSSSDYGGVIAFEPGVDSGEGTHLTDASEFYLPDGLTVVPAPGLAGLEAAALLVVAWLARRRAISSRR